MTAMAAPARPVNRRRVKPERLALHAFLIAISLLWLFPLLWAVYTSFRTYDETAKQGYVSVIQSPTVQNFADAWTGADLPHYYINTLIVVVPALLLVLFLASMVAFAVSRFSWRFNLLLLMVFTAGNLLPPQVMITPLYRIYLALPLPNIAQFVFGADNHLAVFSDNGLWYDQFFGIVAIHVAFQLGFCTFVLSNYFKTLPKELTEAALVDGASVWRVYWQVTMPLARPPLAALATLEFTWIYNDFFWAIILMRTGSKLPVTSGLNNLAGEFFTNNNLLAAGALLVALPTLIVYFALQRQFISGLTLGSTKG
ncbi:MAG TPA: carbohydrate ABC transporter permease [Candidatus Dormibacteraeota bacterium]|nr:carbohydrate ABC transporter permease [Candidatus Dormibacteraeota bacterium]